MSSPERIALVLLAVAFVAALNLTPIHSSDFWIQLAIGDWARSSGELPRTILFACTEARDFDFVATEWLPSLLHSLLYPGLGTPGMVVYKASWAVGLLALSALLAQQVTRSPPLAIAIASAVSLTLNFRLHMRPELYALAFGLASLLLLDRFVRSERALWLAGLLPIGVLWANSHGSFLLMLGLPALFAVGSGIDAWRAGELSGRSRAASRLGRVQLPLLATSLALLALCCLNPRGPELIRHMLQAAPSDYLRENIVEFAPTFGPLIRGRLYFWIYLLFAGAVLLSFLRPLWDGERRVSATALLLLLVFGGLSVDASRFIAWFAIAGGYLLALNLEGWARQPRSADRLGRMLLAVLAVATALVALRGNVNGRRISLAEGAPLSAEALSFLREAEIEGNVFNAYAYGDQLVYHFYPRIRVTIDSRIYREDYYLRYRTLSGRSARRLAAPEQLIGFLDRYAIDTIVTRPYDYRNWQRKNYRPALERAGFATAYLDDSTIILRRRDPRAARPLPIVQ